MNCIDNVSAPVFPKENKILPSKLASFAPPTGDAAEVANTISTTGSFPQMSISGVVNAILEVGNQRKELFSRLRSALQSGSDFEALGFARQLCGLAI
jgi:hypothetical protein